MQSTKNAHFSFSKSVYEIKMAVLVVLDLREIGRKNSFSM